MSQYRRHLEVILDGESFKVTTNYKDQLRAEEATGREKLDVTASPIHMQARVSFYAFGRCHPEHPLARNWNGFIDVYDDINDLEQEDEGSLMDPTQMAD